MNRKQKLIISNLIYGIGWGGTLHAIVRELYDKGGYKEILSMQGEYIFMTILLISWVINNLLIWGIIQCKKKEI